MTDAPEPGSDARKLPSVEAGRRAGPRERGRAYPRREPSPDPAGLAAELAATQALLRAESGHQVRAVVSTLVHDLGGALVPARYADPRTAIPVDVSLGMSEPMLPVADPVSVAAMRLGTVLPEFLETARLVVARIQLDRRRDEEATHDHLTGLLTRRAWMRRLAAAEPGDSVCLIDLDHFKPTNDTQGHAAGDAALRAFGTLMLATFREADACGRYGGDELVGLAPGLDGSGMVAICEQVRGRWESERPAPAALIGLTVGVAQVGEDGGRAALHRADAAMYRGKMQGRNRTVLHSLSPDDEEELA
ncbi:GGDEF domain-containing protein [Aeromicrobium wangtongii]|uniref:GGDEF domain-containing protein n=1 Tax=Aeromicrobium wangtongii TaxID=2969247 RepID=UPI0020179401|nr:GGDEF domain-containing protein [Aeromicrobium wangtongii]MCL3819322.1 GGDEF domain-containing protein [Aeromicrobium wangtongii]